MENTKQQQLCWLQAGIYANMKGSSSSELKRISILANASAEGSYLS